MNKKLSYCCDSGRSYCMQYFNAIHCDRNISITADLRPQSAVRTGCSRTVHGTVSLLTNEPWLFDSHAHV